MKSLSELLAGGDWDGAANCGSRCRNANNYRWNPHPHIGARFGSDTGGDHFGAKLLAGFHGLVSG